MMEIDELAVATGWTGIYQGRDSLVLRFDERDARKINGLRRNGQTFYLNFPEFEQEPISFLVTNGPHQFYYYAVIGDRLSRSGAAAKIAINTETRTTSQEWYHHGLLHNMDGPARITIWGHVNSEVHPRTQEPLPGFLIEEWDGFEAEWFEFGNRAQYPLPFSILAEDGGRLFRTAGDIECLHDAGELPGFFAGKLTGNWTREYDKLTDDSFRLRFLQLTEYYRNYSEGEPISQGAKSLDKLVWIVDGEIVQVDDKKDRERVRKDMLPGWNIWDGPLFPDTQEMLIALNMVK